MEKKVSMGKDDILKEAKETIDTVKKLQSGCPCPNVYKEALEFEKKETRKVWVQNDYDIKDIPEWLKED